MIDAIVDARNHGLSVGISPPSDNGWEPIIIDICSCGYFITSGRVPGGSSVLEISDKIRQMTLSAKCKINQGGMGND